MHQRVSIHQVCFPGSSNRAFAATCREMGAGRISLASPALLTEGGLAEMQAALAPGGLEVETINHPFALFPDLAGDIGRAREMLMRVIGMAHLLDARSIYLLTGGRGPLDWDAAAARFAEAVAPCVEEAEALGLALTIENASPLYADIHIAHGLADTIALAERCGTGICIDLFFAWAEAGVERLLREAVQHYALVQVSDYVLGDRSLPARAVPGDGVIPLERLIGTLLDAGYNGAFDIELIGPRIDAEGHRAAVTRAAERLSELLARLGA